MFPGERWRLVSRRPPFAVLQVELGDEIAVLVANNDHVQEHISQMEEMCHTIEVSGTNPSDGDGG